MYFHSFSFRQAERRDVPCSQALAAFIAKVIILENPARFRLDRKLLKADVDDIISMSIPRPFFPLQTVDRRVI
jgi:hypothetical protein